MNVQHYESVSQQPVDMEGSSGCHVRSLISEAAGAPNFAMRQFEVAPGGYTPRHSHPYEHEVFVLAGQGEVYEGDAPHPIQQGDVFLVTPDEIHQFRNTGDAPLMFLCLIPNDATKKTVTVSPERGIET